MSLSMYIRQIKKIIKGHFVYCLDRGSSSTQIYWLSSHSSVPGKQLLIKGTVGVKVTLLYPSCTTVPFKKG